MSNIEPRQSTSVTPPPPMPGAGASTTLPQSFSPQGVAGHQYGAMAAAGMRRVGKTRNPWGVWALSLVTLGIYGLWWYYTINGELREYDPQIKVQPGVSLCALLFGWVTFGIATIVSIVRTGGRISEAQRSAGAAARCSGLVGLLLGCIGFWQVYYQSQLNKVWEQHGNPPAMTRV